MTKYFTFLITTIIALLSPLHAQPAEHISFVHIGVNEGLSQNTIFDITQDTDLLKFKENKTLQLAIERLFEILGEAANRIPKEYQKNYTQIPWSKIIGMRNIIIHSYERVDFEQLFLTIQNDLPSLKEELDKII